MAGHDDARGDTITVGNVSGSGIAIGGHASARVTIGMTAEDVRRLMAPLREAALAAPPAVRDEAVRTAEAIEGEVVQGDRADDSRMARLLDRLLALAPGAVGAAASIFATPLLTGLAGPATKFVLEKVQGK